MARERFEPDWNDDARYRRGRDRDEEYARGRDWREWPEDYEERGQDRDERNRIGAEQSGRSRTGDYQQRDQRQYAPSYGYGEYGRPQSDRGDFGRRRYYDEDFGQQRGRRSAGRSDQGYGYGGASRYGQGEYPGAYGGETGSGTYGSRGQQANTWDQRNFSQAGPFWPGHHPAGSVGSSSYQGANPWGGAQSHSQSIQAESMRGLGPKNYTRADERIREDVCDLLCDHPAIDASAIDVQVSEGEVTIDGMISSREQRRMVEDCVENVSGVKHVQNNLRIQRESSDTSKSASNAMRSGSGGSVTEI